MCTRLKVLALVGLTTLGGLVACAPEDPPPPPPGQHHVTVWETDVAYADTQPDIVDWEGFGSFAYNAAGPTFGCEILDGGTGWAASFDRIDAATVHVRLSLDWYEGNNGGLGYGCGVNDVLHIGLNDAGGAQVAFELIPLASHS